MTSLINKLIILLIINQFNYLISSSTILTLKSSNAHLNLNQVIDSRFNKTEIQLSFKYKPLNQKFALLSGILDLDSRNTEFNELLKFILLINYNQPELIIHKIDLRDNLLFNYFNLESNQTKVIKREKIDILNKKFNLNDSIQNYSVNYNDNWRLLNIIIAKDQFKIVHTLYSSCLLNGSNQSNCKQQHINYKLINNKNNETERLIELYQLLIGKEWSKLDQSILTEESINQNEIKQLNETEDSHSNSKIHNEFLLMNSHNFQSSNNNERYSGLIGCLNEIQLNGHYLKFKADNDDYIDFISFDINKLKNNTKSINDLIEKENDTNENLIVDWWNIFNYDNILNGKIEFNICNQTDPCKDFCLHNATCMLNEDGRPICHCDLAGYAGQNCYFPLYKQNCKELELLGFGVSGLYIVDADGIGPNPPSHVYCKFKDKETKTLIYHNLVDETVVRGESNVKPFYFKLKYRDFTEDMLVNYMNKFKQCKQEIRFDCHQSIFKFGDYAWFRKLNLNNTLSIVDENSIIIDKEDQNRPNKACSLTGNIWNYEKFTLYNSTILDAYFLPLTSCSNDKSKCNKQNFWQRFIYSSTVSENKNLKHRQMKAKVNKRKRKPEARLTIRTLQSKPGILLHITLKTNDQLYFEIMLKNEFELEFAYPFNDKMKAIKLRSIQRLNTGNWQLIQVFFNDKEMRISVNTISLLFYFDGKSMFDNFKETVYVGGVPHQIGDKKSKIGFIGCFRELRLNFDDDKMINLKKLIHPKLIKQVLPTCKRVCTRNPCENNAVCIEHWSFRRCVCKNKFSHFGFNCELNLNKNSITIISGKPNIHLILNRNFNKFLQNELNEFVNQNTIRTLIDLNAEQLAKSGKLQTDSDSLNQVSVKGVKNLHKSEEKRWSELLLMNSSLLINQNISLNNNQKFGKLIEQPANFLGLNRWDSIEKGKLKMTLQLEFRTRVDAGLLFYANDNLNNFIQLHFVDKKRLCLTFNVLEKIARIEMILEENILNSGEPIQIRIKRYLEYTVFHILIYFKEHNKYEQKTIYVKIPCQFLTTYSHKPFKNADFDYFYKLEPELLFKFENFDGENDSKEGEEEEEEEILNVDTLNNSNDTERKNLEDVNILATKLNNQLNNLTSYIDSNNLNFSAKLIDSNNLKNTQVNNKLNDLKNFNLKNTLNYSNVTNFKITSAGNNLLNQNNTITNNSTSLFKTTNITSQNKFAEQVIPVRGYYKLQVIPKVEMIEITDNAESYDGLVNNLDKIIDDEQTYLKPLHLIYLANLNNFNSYFGLNSTLNTSTSSLTKNIESITTNVILQNKSNITNYVPLLDLLNKTINNNNLTNSLNSSIQTTLEKTLKVSLEIQSKKDSNSNSTMDNELIINKLNGTLINPSNLTNNALNRKSIDSLNNLSNKQKIYFNNTSSNSNLPNSSISKNDERQNLTTTFNTKNYTQIYIGNVDNNNTLSSLPPFVGCISGLIFNNQLINLTKITEKRYEDELKTGKILNGCSMLCDLKNCQNSGKCLDNWKLNKTECDCINTSYTGERCDEDLGSVFNSYNHLFYRLNARNNLLEDQVTFELAFNFNYDEYFNEFKNRYYHQEIEENNLHKHNNRLSNDYDQFKDKLNFENRIILLIIYESNYILLYVNKDNSALILSDVDNKGNELSLKIENNQNNTFFDEYRHYIRYNRKEQTVWLDNKSFKMISYKDVVKHFYLPGQNAYGIYIAGKPNRDKRFNKYSTFSGSICNVKVTLNNQIIEPFNSAFNAVNMSSISIKGQIRQAKCSGFKSKLEPKENSLPFRKKELLNFKWNAPQPEFIPFKHSLFNENEEIDIIIYDLIAFIILAIILIIISIYILIRTIKIYKKKLKERKNTPRIIQKIRRKKSKSLDSVYIGETRLLK